MTNPKKNYLEKILLGVYESDMDTVQRVEMLERALVILAQALGFNDRLSFEEQVAKQEELIRFAKLQALEGMRILPRTDGYD